MIIVLLESTSNVISPFMEKFEEFYPESSRGYIGRRDKVGDIVTRFSRKPLFTGGWLLNCQIGVSKSAIKKLENMNPDNRIVIRVGNNKDLYAERSRLEGLDIHIIDNLKLKYGDVIAWICRELKCGHVIANKIYQRTSGQTKALVDAISTLVAFDSLTEYDVVKYVPKALKYSVYDAFLWMIRQPPRAMKLKDAVRVVYDYQYGMVWFVKYLCEQTEEYLEVFTLALSGKLTLQNYREYKRETENKNITKITEYKLKWIMEAFGKVSYEYLLWFYSTLKTFNVHDPLVCYSVLQLVKLGG